MKDGSFFSYSLFLSFYGNQTEIKGINKGVETLVKCRSSLLKQTLCDSFIDLKDIGKSMVFCEHCQDDSSHNQ
ncbi:hypothetical protein OPV22_001635 [Ensete ventricosum]|uniref:Uncharacterized protein n=1 Tax=Ensete ventricosum TaxID=4639 RepID=A0AAV8QIZ7_ENSVE|nr:hypothetical protein OPV22_001635 [Ensete ventricosum]